ncbi:hypothetical protein I551_2903 [Mycobacterium ulcerans str. Harvey]|uniref:Uncharacterized protein n=1 Tax=Mycobacterium ulcerans str. Harvey TaxID=1299332 RepID=A0ABN0R0T2_MYCUL|nr:hypothetical protein I551_2903 [Mycobacterium ulcerans str. Harvey]
MAPAGVVNLNRYFPLPFGDRSLAAERIAGKCWSTSRSYR